MHGTSSKRRNDEDACAWLTRTAPAHAALNQIPIRPPAEAFDEEVDEDPNLDREVARLRIDRVDRNLGRLVFGEDASQAALLKIGPGDEGRQEGDAAPFHRRVA